MADINPGTCCSYGFQLWTHGSSCHVRWFPPEEKLAVVERSSNAPTRVSTERRERKKVPERSEPNAGSNQFVRSRCPSPSSSQNTAFTTPIPKPSSLSLSISQHSQLPSLRESFLALHGALSTPIHLFANQPKKKKKENRRKREIKELVHQETSGKWREGREKSE